MVFHHKYLLIAVTSVFGASQVLAYGSISPSFLPLSDFPGGTFQSGASGISADGTVVVGLGSSAAGTRAFKWTSATGMSDIGDLPGGSSYSEAYGISGNGATVIGISSATNNLLAFRWTSAGGMAALSDQYSIPRAASGDGSIIVGYVQGVGAVQWRNGIMSSLGALPGSGPNRQAYGVSGDGSVIVGVADEPNGITPRAFRWTASTGMVQLGGLAPGVDIGGAAAISSNGSWIVGNSFDGVSYQACRWSVEGIQGLGYLPGSNAQTSVTSGKAVSADGSRIVGSSVLNGTTTSAIFWDQAHGFRDLKQFLMSQGIQGLGGWQLWEATGVSADGHTIVGRGRNPIGREEAWIAIIPEPSSCLLLLTGASIYLVCPRRRN